MQTNILDALENETNRAIQAAGAFADPEWAQEARSAVSMLCKIGNDFTGDDIWRLLEGTGLKTPEPRALGAIIREFVKDRQIVATGQYRKSIRRESHRRPLQVWRPVNWRNRGEFGDSE